MSSKACRFSPCEGFLDRTYVLAARQVLGDDFCPSPQFDQDNLRSCSTPLRLDDIHGYHRGRRQSEPPELLMYTPEKSRKSLPLLLEGNLPYRRTRRQSAPAKDIEAIFHPNALKQAGSEGELCQADSLGSAGSSSTLASSVIEVEAERPDPGLTPRQRPNQEEEEDDDEEELTPLSPPPTLSITEEILEFINQSRAREGLAAIRVDTTDQDQDQPKGSQPPSNQTNFTSPLPPVTSTSCPEQTPRTQQEQNHADMENDTTIQTHSAEENGLEDETFTTETEEIPDAASQREEEVEADGETQVVEREKDERRADEREGESRDPVPPSDPCPSISAQEHSSSQLLREETSAEVAPSSRSSDVLHPVERSQPPTRGAHVTRRDKKIIEKIRSYYEAAAKAEEDESQEEGEQGEGAASRRRNSVSHIPSGLVKESVFRFNVGGHQGEPEGRPSKCQTTEAIDGEADGEIDGETSCAAAAPAFSPPSVTAENDVEVDEPISSLDINAETPITTIVQEVESPNQIGLSLLSDSIRPPEAEMQELIEEVLIGDPRVVAKPEGNHEEETRGVATGQVDEPSAPEDECRDETSRTSAGNQDVMNGHEPNQEGPAEPHGSHKGPSREPLPPMEQCTRTETKGQSSWTRNKHKDPTKTSTNLEGVPSQIKVGRWSHQSRIVTANRALFEAMGSDVAGIGLFEASPVVDPVLMENSERILSKVQMLAQMYSAKAGTMKVPLHQKRANAILNQSRGSHGLSGLSAQTRSQTQVQAQHQRENHHSGTCVETKSGTQAQSEPNVLSQAKTQIQTKSQTWSQTHFKIQNQTKTQSQSQIQAKSREDQTILKHRKTKRAAGLENDVQEMATAHHRQTNGVILSRPRDFISVLTQERDSNLGWGSGETSQTGCHLESTYKHYPKTQAENQSSSTRYLDCRIDEFRDCRSSGSWNQNGEFCSGTEESKRREGSELRGGRPVHPVREDSVKVFAQSDPSLSAHFAPPWEKSRDGAEAHQQDDPSGPDEPGPEDGVSSGPPDVPDVQRLPEYSGPLRGETPQGELVLILASTQSHGPSEPGPVLAAGRPGSAKVETPSERMLLNETENIVDRAPAEPRATLQGSTLIFTGPVYYRAPGELGQPVHLTFDPTQVSRHTVEETPEEGQETASPWFSGPVPPQLRPPSVQSGDFLPTFTSQRPADLPAAMGKWALSNTWSESDASPCEHSFRDPDQRGPPSCTSPPVSSPSRQPWDTSGLVERPSHTPTVANPAQDPDHSRPPSTFRPNLRNRSPSPVRPFSSSSTLSPCSSPFRIVSVSSPTFLPPDDPALNAVSRATPCSAANPSSRRSSSTRALPGPSPIPSPAVTPSFSRRSSSIRADPPSSPTPSSSLRSPPCSSPVSSSSVFTRSLAASCISQSISQSMARKNSALQQAPPLNTLNESPSSHLRWRSPSPKPPLGQRGSDTPVLAQLGCAEDGLQCPRSGPSSLRSPSPPLTLMQSPPPSLSHRSPSPSVSPTHRQLPHSSSPSPRASFLRAKADSSQNANNNCNVSLAAKSSAISLGGNTSSCNRAAANGGWSVSSQKAALANGSANVVAPQQTHDLLWSHNRAARPFSASEPNSRVHSPAPAPAPASFVRVCSPPPPHNYASLMANKPPHPRSSREDGTSSRNPLGLTLELHRASSTFGQPSMCLSPHVFSPPPIGMSVNIWTNNVAAPQPRNPSSLGSPTFEKASFPTSTPSRTSSPPSPSPPASQTLRRTFSSNMADVPPSPTQRTAGGLHRSWVDGGHRTLGFSGHDRGPFDKQESCPASPRSGRSSSGGSPSCLSPPAGLQSPLSHSGLAPGKGAPGGQHFTGVPWPDVRELSSQYNGTDSPDDIIIMASSLSRCLPASTAPSDGQAEWGDPDLEEGHCRSQLICAYVARPSCEQNPSPSGVTSPSRTPNQHDNYQWKPQPQVHVTPAGPPAASIPHRSPSRPHPLPAAQSSPTNHGNKTSYATTVNLQIAGSGRITSFSTAQVSLTQTLQSGPAAGVPGKGQVTRRVSVNGLSHLPSLLPENRNRL